MRKHKKRAVAIVAVLLLLTVAAVCLNKTKPLPYETESGTACPEETTLVDSDLEIPEITEPETIQRKESGLELDISQIHRNPEPTVVDGTVEYGTKGGTK